MTTTCTEPSGRYAKASASAIVADPSASAATRGARAGVGSLPCLDATAATRGFGIGLAGAGGLRIRARIASPRLAPTAMRTPEIAAATTSHGLSSARLASGSPAPMRTVVTIAA